MLNACVFEGGDGMVSFNKVSCYWIVNVLTPDLICSVQLCVVLIVFSFVLHRLFHMNRWWDRCLLPWSCMGILWQSEGLVWGDIISLPDRDHVRHRQQSGRRSERLRIHLYVFRKTEWRNYERPHTLITYHFLHISAL